MYYASLKKNENVANACVIRTEREVEYLIFASTTQLLVGSEVANDRTLRIDALSRNIKLWQALYSDLSGGGNSLPNELRAGLISLAFFSIAESTRLLVNREPLTEIVEINRSIMRGLRRKSQLKS